MHLLLYLERPASCRPLLGPVARTVPLGGIRAIFPAGGTVAHPIAVRNLGGARIGGRAPDA